MANITVSPQGQIKLCQVPLVNDYKNQLTFASSTAQLTYFNSKVKKTYSNYTYIKKDNVIKVNETIDNIINCNYLFYTNVGFTTKTYFCFITNMRYVNENCTEITFETDVFQTWLFELLYKPCFVEREHVNDDTIGKHTIPENLSVDEVISTFEIQETGIDTSQSFYVILESNYLPLQGSVDGGTPPVGIQFDGISVYNKGIMGNKLIFFKINANRFANDIKNVSRYIKRTNADGHVGDIKNMYIAPTGAINESYLSTVTCKVKDDYGVEQTFTYQATDENNLNTSPTSVTRTISKVNSFTGLTIRNNKCFVYPFNYFTVTNNSGSLNIYKYEDFSTSNCEFGIIMSLVCGVSRTLRTSQL